MMCLKKIFSKEQVIIKKEELSKVVQKTICHHLPQTAVWIRAENVFFGIHFNTECNKNLCKCSWIKVGVKPRNLAEQMHHLLLYSILAHSKNQVTAMQRISPWHMNITTRFLCAGKKGILK